ncbi:unnamed protein product, partial [Coregonus sp. 'balchen']
MFQHIVVLGQPQAVVPQPRDHIIWSLCSLVPSRSGHVPTYRRLGTAPGRCTSAQGSHYLVTLQPRVRQPILLAVYFSIKSRDRKMVGYLEGARKHGNTARCFNTVTLTLVILGLLFLFITYGIIIYQ